MRGCLFLCQPVLLTYFAQVGPEADGGSKDKEIASQPTLSESDEDEGTAGNNKLSSEETLDERQAVEPCNNGKGIGVSDAIPAAGLAGKKINRINSSVEEDKIPPRLASARAASPTSSKMESTALVLLELAEHTRVASSRTNSELERRESAEFQWAKQNVDWNGRYVSSSTKVKRTSDTSNVLTPLALYFRMNYLPTVNSMEIVTCQQSTRRTTALDFGYGLRDKSTRSTERGARAT